MAIVNPHLLRLLQDVQFESLSKGQSPFSIFIKKLESTFTKPPTNLIELRQNNNKKLIGDIFEDFCYLYFLLKKVDNVWTTQNIPNNIKQTLSLPSKDMGIDLIIKEGSEYSAVQVKYRKKTKASHILSWTELSTFYASCLNTGPWKAHIVFTNCDRVHYGYIKNKNQKNINICNKTLQTLTSFDITDMINLINPNNTINTIGSTNTILSTTSTEPNTSETTEEPTASKEPNTSVATEEPTASETTEEPTASRELNTSKTSKATEEPTAGEMLNKLGTTKTLIQDVGKEINKKRVNKKNVDLEILRNNRLNYFTKLNNFK
uniref:Mrr-like domain-containing protein n=1 Tax=viral metagenome TaxID=1070528 RepID=A0A6C0E730_9ZZZZ